VRARAVILITIFVIVWDLVFSSARSTLMTVRDLVRYRLVRGTYHTVAYKWRWRVVEKFRLMTGSRHP
jgi:hypothetical protein